LGRERLVFGSILFTAVLWMPPPMASGCALSTHLPIWN